MDAAGFPSPFWVLEGTVEAALEPEADPLVELVAAGNGDVRGEAPARHGDVVGCMFWMMNILINAAAPEFHSSRVLNTAAGYLIGSSMR